MEKTIEQLTQEDVNKIHSYYHDDVIGCSKCPLFDSELNFILDCNKFELYITKHKQALNKKIQVLNKKILINN